MNASEQIYRLSGAGKSQTETLIEYMVAHANHWVPMPVLAEQLNAYAVHSRVSDARKAGYQIDHKNEFTRDGAGRRVVHSFYRLTQ